MINRCWRTLACICAEAAVLWPALGAMQAEQGMSTERMGVWDTGAHLVPVAQATQKGTTVSLHVDGATGNDANNGLPAKPFRTVLRGIKAAAASNRSGISVTVFVKPGVYREAVAFPSQAYTASQIRLISTTPGGAIIDGSNLYTGWTESSRSIYTHPWTPFPPCVCPFEAQHCPSGIGMRRELVFVNGARLTQVPSLAAMKPGTYFVDDRAGRLYVQTPTGVSPDAVATEVSVRRSIFIAKGILDFELQGFVIRRSADCAAVDTAVDIEDCATLVLRDLTIVDNNDEGLFVSNCGARSVRITRVHADRNGFLGMDIYKSKNLVVEDTSTNDNNWRGKLVNYSGWFAAGIKWGSVHRATINRWTATHNWTDAFWFDTDCSDIVVNDLVSTHNAGNGVTVEACQGPITLNRPILCQNGTPYGASAILGQASSDVTVNRAIVFQNDPNTGTMVGIGLGDHPGPEDVVDWETGRHIQVMTRRWTIMHSVVVTRNPRQYVFETDTDNHGFWQTLMANRNVWWNPDEPKAFGRGPDPVTGDVDFSGYKRWLRPGQEANSVWMNPFSNDPTTTCTFAWVRGVWPR